MLSDRKDLLDEIGFIWRDRVEYKSAIVSITDELRHTKWYNQYEKLVEFKRKNGHCMVPFKYEQDMSLGKWVTNQRSSHTNDKIRQDRKELLDEIGFAWSVERSGVVQRTNESRENIWNMHYEKLVEFKRKNGHCRVPYRYQHDDSLGKWVSSQRTGHANGVMLSVRKDLLDEIGFAWKGAGRYHNNNKIWHHQYEKLVEFKRTNGHCIVPQKYEQDKSLGIWVSTQRIFHTNNIIRQDRKDLLDEIGFAWKAESARYTNHGYKLWHQQYKKLVEFERKHGHCAVPYRYEQDKSIGKWVSHQRARHARKTMRSATMKLLDEIGFAWKPDTLPARSSTTDVRSLVIGSFHPWDRPCF
jgi:uncharacterized protein YbgA (DUF1722 family)